MSLRLRANMKPSNETNFKTFWKLNTQKLQNTSLIFSQTRVDSCTTPLVEGRTRTHTSPTPSEAGQARFSHSTEKVHLVRVSARSNC